MNTFFKSSIEMIRNPLTFNSVSDQPRSYTKIVCIALAILGAITACVVLYRYFAKRVNANDSTIPSHVTPHPVSNPVPHSPKNSSNPKSKIPPPSQPVIPSQSDSLIDESEKRAKQLEEASEKFARELQAIEDAAAARHYQKQYQQESSSSFDSIVSTPQPVMTTPPQPVIVKSDNPFDQIEEICGEIAEKMFNPSFSAVKAFQALDPKTTQLTLNLLNEIIAEFERRHSVSQKIQYGSLVPPYFANIVEQREEDRKYLSLVGLRNLLLCQGVFDDFIKTKFLGGTHHYGHQQGLHLFHYYTGNLVDLDSDFEEPDDQTAIKRAEEIIVKFGKKYGLQKPRSGELTAKDVVDLLPDRKLSLPSPYESVHVSYSHTDRSNFGIWKRNTAAQPVGGGRYCHTYYVNVPNFDVVLIATLKLPYLLAELAYKVKEQNKGTISQEFFDDFFKNGLSTKCFNDKTKTFVEFKMKWDEKLSPPPSTPEEDARQKILDGEFGTALKKKGPHLVFKEAYTLFSLSNLLEDYELDRNGLSFAEWKKKNKGTIITILKEKKLWEAVLYQTEEDADFFLLDEKTLDGALQNIYDARMD